MEGFNPAVGDMVELNFCEWRLGRVTEIKRLNNGEQAFHVVMNDNLRITFLNVRIENLAPIGTHTK